MRNGPNPAPRTASPDRACARGYKYTKLSIQNKRDATRTYHPYFIGKKADRGAALYNNKTRTNCELRDSGTVGEEGRHQGSEKLAVFLIEISLFLLELYDDDEQL